MKKFLLILFLHFIVFNSINAQTVYAPVPVTKSNTKKVFVHVMPWFETKSSNGGTWGYHWKMVSKNPDNILPNGQRDIAAWYYPKIGPYASGNPDVVEYQLLLIKLAGIDGIMIDWYGTQNKFDYPKNKANSEKLIALLQKVGLNYSIVYEDATLNNATDKIATAKADMAYMQTNYFSQSNYEKYNNKPLLLDFGPQGLSGESNWTNVFSDLSPKPSFFPLWYNYNAGTNASGYFAWIYSDYLTGLNNFYNNNSFPSKIGSAYPGFKDYYTQGGAADGINWEIAHNGTATFNATLDLALSKNLPYIQLNTWNDYGEGTMIEPTVEFGYSFLTSIQTKLGVSGLNQHDLELVDTLYDQRKLYSGNATEQARLDQAFYYMVSLQMGAAEALLLGTTYTPPPPLPDPWDSTHVGAAAGSAGYNLDTFKVSGSGADIYGTTDAFQYAYQPITGDVTIIAKVLSIDNTNVWAKAGLMIRDGLGATAKNATIVITPSNGINFQYRSTVAGVTTNNGGNTFATPYWLKLVRAGNVITGYYSSDGNTWTQLGTISIEMSATIYVGMAVTSHNDGNIANGIFTNVSVTQPPFINSFSPTYGLTGSTVTILGKNFTGASAVSLGGVAVSSFTVISDSVITAIVANGQTGNINVTTAYSTASRSGFFYQLCSGVSTILTSNLIGTNYQWQVDAGTGFANITNNANYAGTNTMALQLNALPSSMNAYRYRCVVDGNNSNAFTLRFVNRWIGGINTSWETPGNWSCGVLPDSNTDVVISGAYVVINSDPTIRSLTVDASSFIMVNAGKKVVINH
ncbi:hypothetical protein ACQ33O_10490 [Ferruginibacter sp. SUN002]|uniref:hypothetical protein n=1 Tax=Ferruginibacter sp. SUN002 TaxID=2937789 RepID=UPI003D36B7FB